MQPWLLAVAAPGGQKARQMEGSPRICRLQPLCRGTQSNGLDFTFDTSWTTRFELFGLVPDQTFHYRHTSRRKTQRLALDQDSSELDAVQQSLSNQAAGSPAASSAGSGSRACSSDLDFSSFIIGDGPLTARLVLIVR